MKKSYLLIDCSNIHEANDPNNELLTDSLTKWVERTHENLDEKLELIIRLYGGWLSKGSTTDHRHKAIEYYTLKYPRFLKAWGQIVRIKIEFADYIFGNEGMENYKIDNTTILRKSKERYKRVENAVTCTIVNCEVEKMRKWLRNKKACSHSECPNAFFDYFSRMDQKQIDTFLLADAMLIGSQNNFSTLGIASDDIDFAPLFLALISLGKEKLSSFRSNTTCWYVDDFLISSGVTIYKGVL